MQCLLIVFSIIDLLLSHVAGNAKRPVEHLAVGFVISDWHGGCYGCCASVFVGESGDEIQARSVPFFATPACARNHRTRLKASFHSVHFASILSVVAKFFFDSQ